LSKIRLASVGCGGMGNRHFNGLVELTRAGLSSFELVAACDPARENAQRLAKRAEELLGKKIAVVEKLDELASLGVQAIDVTTVPWEHHNIAIEALQRGWHVMVEKPMGLTVRACKMMLEAAKKSQAILSIAENFHYDPMNLIGRELLKNEVIGSPRLMLHNSVGGGDSIIVTPWRHLKHGGGPLLDVGVHYTYMVEYLMGDVDNIYAQARLYEKIRKGNEMQIEADAEDSACATLMFHNGAVGQYIEDHAGHGQGLWQRVVYGSKGSLQLPSDRTGKPVVMMLDGHGIINNERILEFIPEFYLNKFTASLFGGERIWHYDFPFADIDSKLIAVEYADFAESIMEGRSPGVDPLQAARSVGLAYAMLESSRLERIVKMDEIMKEEVHTYQDEINKSIGLD
jgi:predicted dehydrogenase